MKQVRALKGWTVGYENANAVIGDLETLYEFYEAGDVTEEEVDEEARMPADAELQPAKRLGKLRLPRLDAGQPAGEYALRSDRAPDPRIDGHHCF
jgi:hypothetical protein